MIAEIAQDIAEMALYAASPETAGQQVDFTIEGPDAIVEPPRATVSLVLGPAGRTRHDIAIQHHIWSPADYTEFARAAAQKLGLQVPPAPPSVDEGLLKALLTPLPRVIETQNQRVSAMLRQSMLDPNAHEQAALVVAALALREAAGRLFDVRQLLCRMTAHLALARALRDEAEPGLAGRYAEAALATLAGRNADAVEALKDLSNTADVSETQAAWIRALTMKNTYDWRMLQAPARASLFEKREYFGAVIWTMHPSAALRFLPEEEAEPVTDWARMTLEGDFATEAGSFMDIEDEIAEASDIWLRAHGRPLPRGELVEALNQSAERFLTRDGPQVLGWGAWAASAQRHLCHRVLTSDLYWRRTLALEAEGHARIADFDSAYGGLALYPFVQALRWKHGGIELESFIDGLRTGIATAAEHPELVPPLPWDEAREVANYAVIRRRMPDPGLWFARTIPYGTAHDARHRVVNLTPAPGGEATIGALEQRNPWSFFLNLRLLRDAHGENVTAGDIRREFGERADYDLRVLGWMASVSNSFEERRQILEQRCEIFVDECIDLGTYLIQEKQDEDAARALRRAFDEGSDPVYMANNSRFLVHHYFKSGRVDDAMRIAQRGADTYAGGGLATMGELLEWQGKFAEAEDYFLQIERRYEDSDALRGFYYRMVWVNRQQSYEPKFRSLTDEAFPNGLERLDPEKLAPGRPADGVRILSSNRFLRRIGLNMGDIIVGLDGWRVHNQRQFLIVNEFSRAPDMRLQVWQNDRYSQIEARVVVRDFGVELKSFP